MKHLLPNGSKGQLGQALAEGLVVMAALMLLWILAGWLMRLQDVALQASNASRYAAFDLARYSDTNSRTGQIQFSGSPDAYFSGAGQRWFDIRGRSWLANKTDLRVGGEPGNPLPADAQPGGEATIASVLRSQWALADTGVREVGVAVQPQTSIQNQPQTIQRHAFIVVGTGHTSSDANTVGRLRESDLAWAHTEAASAQAGRALAARLVPLDAAWPRPEPDFDWLGPWQWQVPEHHLQLSQPGLRLPSFQQGSP